MEGLKIAAARAAVEMLPASGVIGLGSGTTLAYAIEEVGKRMRAGRMDIVGVPTSYQARLLARQYGIPLRDPMDVDRIDVTMDGADEIDPQGNLIKGGGGAHATEKLVAAASRQLIVIADESKIVPQLGQRFAVPADVFPAALAFAMRCFRDLGGEPEIRTGKGKIGPVISDLGNIVVDIRFGGIADPARLDAQLNAIPGVVAHGLFVGLASQAVIAKLPADSPTVQVLEFRRTSTLTT